MLYMEKILVPGGYVVMGMADLEALIEMLNVMKEKRQKEANRKKARAWAAEVLRDYGEMVDRNIRDGNTVYTLMNEIGDYEWQMARCSPDDEFDMTIGIAINLYRQVTNSNDLPDFI